MVLQKGPEPLYRQLAADLRRRIDSGEFDPDRQIPSLTVLQREYEISDRTARAAVALLRDAGVIVSTPGLGNFAL